MGHEGKEGAHSPLAVAEILALPKANKTTGVEHRLVLYDMLRSVIPTNDVASTITKALLTLIVKETNDVAMSLLAQTIALHITFQLRTNQGLEPEVINVILREMTSPKAGLRRIFCTIAGRALWDLGNDLSDAAQSFAASVYPVFESTLKTISANPLNSTAGSLEGYVSLAALLGPVSHLGVQNYGDARSPEVLLCNAASHIIK